MREIHNTLQKEATLDIPISVFSAQLSPLESVVKYLREQYGFSFVEIANILNRDARNISAAYRKYKHKRIIYATSRYKLPASLFANKYLSILEHVCMRLHSEGIDPHRIAKLIDKQYSTVYTVLRRARMKIDERQETHNRRSDLIKYLKDKHKLTNAEIAVTLNISPFDVEELGGGDQ